jgi:23S rRNA (cytidine1920-2'-O)/16S rRNA (cytidine1409-2'-O)-methyltransferase
VRRRLDVEMVRRGIVGNRTEAAEAIRSGRVVVGGRPEPKASTLVSPDESIAIAGLTRRFVSRGGEKLEAAIDRFGIDVASRRALDAGASTGGFTDCLLSRGAAHVIAVDVGYGQLDWRIREDPRVTVLERTNIREIEPDSLLYRADVVVADLSFIALATAMPALVSCSGADAEFVLLVKPQFEAGRADVGSGGVVADPDVWRGVLSSVAAACAHEGLQPDGVMASPLLGPAGNAEFLLHATRGAAAHDAGEIGGRVGWRFLTTGIDGAIEEAMSLPGRDRTAGMEAHGAGS